MHDFLDKNHFIKVQKDSLFAHMAINKFFLSHDASGYYLDETTRAAIYNGWGTLLDNIDDGGCEFLELLTSQIIQRETEVLEIVSTDRFWQFEYSQEAELLPIKEGHFHNIETVTHWRELVQLETFFAYFEYDPKSKTKQEYLLQFDSLKTEVRSVWDCRLEVSTSKELKKEFLQSTIAVYDDYTQFFDTEDAEEFAAQLSSDFYGLGLFVSKNFKGEVIVEEIITNSPAERAGITEGDFIFSYFKSEEPIALECFSDGELNQMLIGEEALNHVFEYGSSYEERKAASLIKTRLELHSKGVQSFILNGERSIGYIRIPSFYYSQDDGGSSVTTDVAVSILKLRRKKIDGLILDLQGNGGGAMDEAISMLSLFLDYGSLFQIMDSDSTLQTIKDPVRGLSYYGPLMVLVDGMSASASELLAMVLMEQKRALIVGAKTYGKATSQTIVPIGENEEPMSLLLKFTGGAWYSLKGYSFHGMGIGPHIKIPSVRFERSQNRPFGKLKSELKPREVYHNIEASKLQVMSSLRFQEDSVLIGLKEANSGVSNITNQKAPISVSYENMEKVFAQMQVLKKGFNTLPFSIDEMEATDSDLDEMSNNLIVVEGYNIFLDWLTLLKK